MKKIYWSLICVFGIFVAQTVNAEEWQHHLNVNLASYHFNQSKSYNEFNPGLGYEGKYRDWRFFTGAYYNSYKNWSIYALAGYTPIHWQVTQNNEITLGIALGLASGYEKVRINWFPQHHKIGIIPMGGLMLTWHPTQIKKFGLNFFVVPPLKKSDMSGFTGLQLKFLL
jgi:hypothetical protein